MIIKHARGHSVRKNHCNSLPRYLVVLDTETMPLACDQDATIWRHEWRLAVAITCRVVGDKFEQERVHRLKHPDDLLELLGKYTRDRQTLWVVAHNLLFDFITAQFPTMFERGLITLDWPRSKRTKEDGDPDNPHCHGFAVLKNPPTIIGCKLASTQGRILLLDSCNWFNMPLAELGQLVGLPKLPMPEFKVSAEPWFTYCERDCRILLVAMQKLIQWVRSANLGMFRYTIASQAWHAWRHRFMDRCVYPHNEPDVQTLERASYFGGRSECFYIGAIREQCHKLDVSSLFPSVMQKHLVPIELLEHEKRTRYTDYVPGESLIDTVAEVVVCRSRSDYPCRTNGPTIYPTGTFATTLAGPELEHARKHGCLKAIKSWARYRLANIFLRWVDELWEMRKAFEAEGDTLYAALTKKMLVSLYGKWAERGEDWQIRPTIHPQRAWSKWERYNCQTRQTQQYRSLGWTTQEFMGLTEKNNRLIAISAWVTSYGRLRMNELRAIAGRDNSFYQCVDALIVNDTGLSNLTKSGAVEERSLGQLRLIDSQADGHIYGIGDYRMGPHSVVAGRSTRAKMLDDNSYQVQKFVGLERLFSGIVPTAMMEELQQWTRTHNYTKGMVDDDGWVKPFDYAADDDYNGVAAMS